MPAPAAAAAPERIPPKPWGIPAILLALLLPGVLWGSSLVVAIVQDTPDELSDGEIATGLVITIVLDFVFIGLAAGLSLWRYRVGWGALGLRRFHRNIVYDIVLLGVGMLLVVLAALASLATNWLDWRSLYRRFIRHNFWSIPLAAAAAAHVGIVVYTAVFILVGADAAVPEQDIDELFESRAVLPLAGVATVIMAPLAEEIFFRGFIFTGLLRPFGLRGAMAASGLLFGAFHVTSPETVGLVLPFGVVGMLFAWVYYRTGSLWPAIATHFLFNLVSFVILASVVGSGSG